MNEHSHTYVLGVSARAWAGSTEADAPLGASVRVRAGAASVVSIRGELDIATEDIFDDLMNDAISQYGPDVIVDASGISFCDARGLGALVHAANDTRRAGGALTLINTSRPLTRLLRIAGLDWRRSAPVSRTPRPGIGQCHRAS